MLRLARGREPSRGYNWFEEFETPIPPPDGGELVTRRGVGDFVAELPKHEHDKMEWQLAVMELMRAATRDLAWRFFARIAIMKALYGKTPPPIGGKPADKDDDAMALGPQAECVAVTGPPRFGDRHCFVTANPINRQAPTLIVSPSTTMNSPRSIGSAITTVAANSAAASNRMARCLVESFTPSRSTGWAGELGYSA